MFLLRKCKRNIIHTYNYFYLYLFDKIALSSL